MRMQNEKVGRNSFCPCGSGKKFKKCCMGKPSQSKQFVSKPSPPQNNLANYYAKKFQIFLKTERDIEYIRKAGKLVVETLDLVESKLVAGITTEEINTIVHDFTVKNGAKPATLNYNGYLKSTCVSVDNEVCHGVPGCRVIQEGNIVNVDITSILNGYLADANKTFFVGTPSAEAQKVVSVAETCMRKGIKKVRPGNTIGDIGWTIQQYAEQQNCSVVEAYVGHGVGFAFHELPLVPHFGKKGDGIRLIPGMVFTIEPMINLGKKEVRVLSDKWTAVTVDNSLSAQFEQTLLVTENGYESLTPF
ncbi:MAG: type I methionyl aminopeptidase [Candidatus Magnetomorum sp.]|nr:type I methionyl aminopeptidase [Candidatus Magnetomorum sp.]